MEVRGLLRREGGSRSKMRRFTGEGGGNHRAM